MAPEAQPTTITITLGEIETAIPAAAFQPKNGPARQQPQHTKTPGTIAFGEIVVPTRTTEIVAVPVTVEPNDGRTNFLQNTGAESAIVINRVSRRKAGTTNGV